MSLTPEEGRRIVDDALAYIRSKGIEVRVTPYKFKNLPELKEKFSGPERLRPKDWTMAQFHVETQGERNIVYKEQAKLFDQGIRFDSGGCGGVLDWELDWSFKVGDEPESTESIEVLKDLMDKLNEEGASNGSEKCQVC